MEEWEGGRGERLIEEPDRFFLFVGEINTLLQKSIDQRGGLIPFC